MWRVHRLDQISAKKPANLFDSMSLTLRYWNKLIGRFFYPCRESTRDRLLADHPLGESSSDCALASGASTADSCRPANIGRCFWRDEARQPARAHFRNPACPPETYDGLPKTRMGNE